MSERDIAILAYIVILVLVCGLVAWLSRREDGRAG